MTTIYDKQVRSLQDLSADKATFRLRGFSGVATANAATNIDCLLPTECWVSGGTLYIQSPAWADKFSLHVIDVNNVLGYGAGVNLGTYVTDCYVANEAIFSISVEAPYIALLPAGVYLRISYTNTAGTDTKVIMNVTTHIPKA